MSRGLQPHHRKMAIVSWLEVEILDPMSRGLRLGGSPCTSARGRNVEILDPMSRGLRLVENLLLWLPEKIVLVEILDPMSRGLRPSMTTW